MLSFLPNFSSYCYLFYFIHSFPITRYQTVAEFFNLLTGEKILNISDNFI